MDVVHWELLTLQAPGDHIHIAVQMQLQSTVALESLIFMFSLVLLLALWHRRNFLVKKQLTVNRLFFARLWISHSRRQGEQITLQIST